jgi:hypothetical protein
MLLPEKPWELGSDTIASARRDFHRYIGCIYGEYIDGNLWGFLLDISMGICIWVLIFFDVSMGI